MPGPFILQVLPVVDNSKIESTVNKPLEKSASTFEKSITNTTNEAVKITSSTLSTFSTIDFSGFPETPLSQKVIVAGGAGFLIGAGAGLAGGPAAPITSPVGGIGVGLTGIAAVLAEDHFEAKKILSQINFANIEISGGEFLKNPALKDKLLEVAKTGIFGQTNADIADLVLDFQTRTGQILDSKEFLESQFSFESLLFKDERFENIDEILNKAREGVGGLNNEQNKLDQTTNKLNQTTEQTNQLNQELANTQSTAATANKQNVEAVKQNNTELQNGVGILELTDQQLLNIPDSLAMVGDGLVANTGAQEKYNEEVAQAEKKLDNLGGAAVGADKDTKKLVKQVGDLNDETSDINIEDKLSNIDVDPITAEDIIEKEALAQPDKLGDGLVKAAETGKKGLSSLGVFAGNIATNIAESFSGFISTAIKGDFDGIGDLWDDLLDSLQNSFADLVGGFLTNPIRIAFESTLKGEGGIKDFFKDLFGGGKDKTEENPQNVIFLDEFREKRAVIHQIDENKWKFRLVA